MITLITGAPGSGKTLYCVSKLLTAIVGTSVDGSDDDEKPVKYPRTIYTNIRNLLIDHEMVDESWLANWFDNIKPGAFIVFDEVQKPWPNRPVGSKVPEFIQRLETHRHQGCDFVLLTQNPQLIDPNVRKLVGRHLHIRRVANMASAIVYEWDGCSNSLNFKNSFTKSPWFFPKSAYKLYKSADLHTKVPRRLPAVAFAAVFGIIGAFSMWPYFLDRITQPLSKAVPKVPSSTVLTSAVSPATQSAFPDGLSATLGDTPQANTQNPLVAAYASPAEQFSGCIQAKTACACYTVQGVKVEKPSDYCIASTAPGSVQLMIKIPALDLDKFGFDVTSPIPQSAPDLDLVQWVNRERKPPPITMW